MKNAWTRKMFSSRNMKNAWSRNMTNGWSSQNGIQLEENSITSTDTTPQRTSQTPTTALPTATQNHHVVIFFIYQYINKS